MNGVVSSGYYSDALDRPTQMINASNQGSVKSQTTFSYDDTNRIVTSTSDLNTFNDQYPLKAQTLYDGLGRTIETRQYETASNYIAVQKVPFLVLQDGAAWFQASKSSNPFRPYLGEQAVWSTSLADSLGRVVKVKTPDNAVVTTSYAGNTVTASDQTAKQRKSVIDALGRLKDVYEAPNDSSNEL